MCERGDDEVPAGTHARPHALLLFDEERLNSHLLSLVYVCVKAISKSLSRVWFNGFLLQFFLIFLPWFIFASCLLIKPADVRHVQRRVSQQESAVRA